MKKDFGMGFVSSFKCPELVDFFFLNNVFFPTLFLSFHFALYKIPEEKNEKKNLLFIESYFSFLEFFILMGTAV